MHHQPPDITASHFTSINLSKPSTEPIQEIFIKNSVASGRVFYLI